MEISDSVRSDILNIQNQLKIAIQNHQHVFKEMKSDPNNVQMKKRLVGVENHIVLLGVKQKEIVGRLRKEINSKTTNRALAVRSVALSLGLNNNAVNIQNNNKTNNVVSQSMPVRPSSVASTSSSSTSESEESKRKKSDLEKVVEKCVNRVQNDPHEVAKLQFMGSLGLVTREALSEHVSEQQNKRVERKRRSTANHNQFVYGSSWEINIKRKKSCYLSSGVPTPPRRSLRVETPAAVENEPLRIPGLPASLTIERIKTQVCVVCRTPGSQLGVCATCSTEYHTSCAPDCPQCDGNMDTIAINLKEAQKEQLRKDKEAHKEQFINRNIQLRRDKELSRNIQLKKDKEAHKEQFLSRNVQLRRDKEAQKEQFLSRNVQLKRDKETQKEQFLSRNVQLRRHKEAQKEQISRNIQLKEDDETQKGQLCSRNIQLKEDDEAHKEQISRNIQLRKDKGAQKDQLLSENIQLNKDKENLQKQAAELNEAISAQETRNKCLLRTEEATRKKIQTICDFVSILKMAPLPPS
ncbi:hypothetical protein L9F63_000653 [Diploptera punctata]|uniref:Uncharacterized protein n=1 Tax=Diploptera punctata TaxID=6984 RepID=A0AAD8AM07_DIPPU|nr:hypothetical protein L9F63_000653 [Diploptera punctata]